MKTYKSFMALFLTLPLMAILMSCASTTTYIVAPEKGDCYGVAPRKCLLVKKNKTDTEWLNFYSPIEGFDFVPGYEYVIKVKEHKIIDVPADASSVHYVLHKVVSKTPVANP